MHKRLRRYRLAALPGALVLAGAVPAVAQTSQPVAPTREEIERRQQPAPVPPATIEIEGGLERPPCLLDSPQFADLRFTLRDVAFDGLGGIDPALLRPAFESQVGSEQPVSVVCDIRDRAAAILRDSGYIAAILVPEQSVAEGRLRLEVVLARLVDVRVLGDAGRSERLLAAYLERLKGQPVFNRFDAERSLLLASDLPGFYVRLALRPAGRAPGEVVGEVTVARIPFALDASVQNYGSHELGRWGGLVRGQLFGLTGLGDVTTLTAYAAAQTREQHGVQLAHEFRPGASGLTLFGSFNHDWSRPDVEGPDNLKARTLVASAGVAYPLIRRLDLTLRGSLGLDVINQSVRQDGDLFTRDRLRMAFARLTLDRAGTNAGKSGYSAFEPQWRYGGAVELRHGLDLFDASQRCGTECLVAGGLPLSRTRADPTPGIARASLYGEFRPVPKLALAANVRAQLADVRLPSYEQFAAGNFTVGRGYDPGTILGDRGVAAQGEIRFGSLMPKDTRSLAAQGFAFVDHAWVGNEDRDFLPSGQRHLTSIGAGIRASFRGFGIESMLAVPLERTGFADRKPDPRLLVSISRRLWPWTW
jgi:hemolysin activation/secretion protein